MLEVFAILVAVIAIFVILFWLKKTVFIFGFFFKVFTLLFIVLMVVGIIFGYKVYKDAKDFKNNFGNSTNLFILKETVNGTDKFLSGVTIETKSREFKTITESELVKAEKSYNEDEMETLNDKYYKIFIIDFKAINDVQQYNIDDKNVNLTKEEMQQIMESSQAKSELAKILSSKNGFKKTDIIEALQANDEEVKAYIFSYYLTNLFEPENTQELLKQLKKKNIIVYEETALFKAIKLLPISLIDDVVAKQKTVQIQN